MMKVASRWFLPGLCVSVPLALFVLFTYIYPRPYYVFETDIEPDYYYNARLVLDGQPTGLHHPGTLIYYLGALVLKMTGTELDHTQQFLNACYLVVAAASIGGLLIFWRRLLQDMPLGIGALTLVLAMAWPTWLNYSNYFGADSFTLAVGLPVSALLWRLFATPHHKSWWLFALTGASLGLALSIKMTFVPFVAAAFGGVGIGQLLQSGSTWTGATGKLSRAIQRTLQMTVGLVVSFIICITPAWAKALAVWYQTFRRPDVKTAGFGAIPALGDAAHLLFEANPLLTLLFASVSVWFVFTVIKLLRHQTNNSNPASAITSLDTRSAAAFLGLLLIFFIYTATAIAGGDGNAGIILRNLAPCALFFPLAAVFCFQLCPSDSAVKIWLTRKSYLLIVLAVFTLLAGIYLKNKSRIALVETRTGAIAATRAGLLAYELQGTRLAFWTSSGENYLGEASFHFWGNYHYGDKLYYPYLLKQFPKLMYFQLRNARRIFEEENLPPNASAIKPVGKFRFWWSHVRDTLLSTGLPSPLDGGYFYEGSENVKPILIAFTADQLNDPLIQPFTLDELDKILEQTYGRVSVSHVKFGDTEWVIIKLTSQNAAN